MEVDDRADAGRIGTVVTMHDGSGFAEPIVHVDMDAFFVEVERLDDPKLVGRSVVVGGLGGRGVVASASYEARVDGVHSAMPMAHARRRSPGAVYLAPRHERYREVSRQIFALLDTISPTVEPLSIDEAFLDVGGLRLLHRSVEEIGTTIRTRLRAEVGVPASVGIATTKMLAKMASDAAKPDGLLRIPAGDELTFLRPLPVRKLWGVGEATHATLEGMGVRTIGDLADVGSVVLGRRLGPTLAGHLSELAAGRDPRPVGPEETVRSVSVEETFGIDLDDDARIATELLALCDRLASRLRRSDARGRTVVLKVRFADFTTITRSETCPTPLHSTAELWEVAKRLIGRANRGGRAIRLLGIGVAALDGPEVPEQLTLGHQPGRVPASVVDDVRARFGDRALRPARLVDQPQEQPLLPDDLRP